ncbi:DUF1515 family protein [Mesorhizobium retamae]|uniref:DUF1515 domain-containing protein n=1 Tax=Mesorhizobium retamae TaxID=2912854 RepID=A0ABS9Q7J3_9HYPH|nr:DUF1515 family protein [Mesorhizobium sp. IRAMC:0171]MCG7503400.1 DUF1515 domain-containing protein [Mesorhizobium sp. IRAMC:0171]
MPQFLRWMMLHCVLPLAACSQTVRVSDCDGVAKLTPSSETRRLIIANDRRMWKLMGLGALGVVGIGGASLPATHRLAFKAVRPHRLTALFLAT